MTTNHRVCLRSGAGRFGLIRPRLAGRPHRETDPHVEYAALVDTQYVEAIDGGEPVLNRLASFGLEPTPTTYSHLLYGWSLPGGRRAVLSVVDCWTA
jgi:hypothetical protein